MRGRGPFVNEGSEKKLYCTENKSGYRMKEMHYVRSECLLGLEGFGCLINPKKGGKYGGEEDFDDRWGFCGGL